MNKLYFGDNLEILKSLYKEYSQGFIDLIYIDPPFNSKRNYNILFENAELTNTKAQKEAFADTWSNVSYKDTLDKIADLNQNLFYFLKALDRISTSKSEVSYLTTMTVRIIYMHKLLKDTGSFYLHCDPTMSHYLKMICDFIFNKKNFRNEIIWWYHDPSGKTDRRFMRKHDIILFYAKNDNKYYFNVDAVRTPYKKGTFEQGEKGIISFGRPTKIHLLGRHPEDVWEIPIINSMAKERLGYPTQKPELLLERVIKASSNEGDLVADFFCGCGTTVAVAQRLKRNWLGVDISHLAIRLVANRLIGTFGKNIRNTFSIQGFPKDIDSAKELAENTSGGRLKFEEWIVEVMLHGVLNENRTQMGYDGYFTFDLQGEKQIGMIEVKSGDATPTKLNHFIKTFEEKNGSIGVFVCFKEKITKNMQIIAKEQGYYNETIFGRQYSKIQIISVEDLLNGITIDMPHSTKTTFKVASRDIPLTDQTKLKL
ncbi:MAG: site-specific DNA-methyltransferase [Candidatus Stahlbacteria bacterium]|nr:site-specific DNA-methyltransferase [Candidatus Stahlbacteria bacterium]